MVFLKLYITFFVALFACGSSAQNVYTDTHVFHHSSDVYTSFQIKRFPSSGLFHLILYCDDGFLYQHTHYPQCIVTLIGKRDGIYFNKTKVTEHYSLIIPKNNVFYCDGACYRGCLLIEKQRSGVIIRVINFGSTYETMIERLNMGLKQFQSKRASERKPDQLYHVRVLLAEQSRAAGSIEWRVSSPAGFGVLDLEGDEQKRFYNMRDMTIVAKHGQFFINDVRYPAQKFLIVPREGHLSFDGKDYHGNFIIVFDKNNYYLINSLDIEDYVFSVLRTETWPGWPLEINKVCAIASRTYVVGVICNTRKSGLPYHVKNTTAHQTYGGIHPDATLRKAVQETHGIFVAYDNKPIIAMFDAVCGGVVPAQVKGVNFHHAPYLKRTTACNYCKNAKGYRWSTRISEKQMAQLLKEPLPRLKKVKNLIITKSDKAGVVHEIAVHGTGISHGIARLNGKQCYFLFKPKGVRSFHFEIKHNSPHFIISGKGIGHHMGLCQWGARKLVNHGWDYKKILEFYYPGTALMRFY